MVSRVSEMVAVNEHSKVMGMTSEQIITGIRKGKYIGHLIKGEWFVLPYSIDKGHGPSIHDIINGINKGIYDGKIINGNWYVSCASINRRIELSVDEMIRRISDDTYHGQQVDGEWYVLISSISVRKKPKESDFIDIRRHIFQWYGIPPSLIMLNESIGYRNYTDAELVSIFIFGALFILMLSWIASMFSHAVIVRSRIRSNNHSTKFGRYVWISIFIWIAFATTLGIIWNDMAIDNWLATVDHASQF